MREGDGVGRGPATAWGAGGAWRFSVGGEQGAGVWEAVLEPVREGAAAHRCGRGGAAVPAFSLVQRTARWRWQLRAACPPGARR